MLILTRRIGESIISRMDIGKLEASAGATLFEGASTNNNAMKASLEATVKLVVLGIKGNQVRFGIEAPSYVDVHREEIHLRIQREQQRQEQGIPFAEEEEEE